MTRQDFIKKWFFYGLGLFPIWVLDCMLLCRYPVYGTTPVLLPLAVAAVATLEGQVAGGAFGMWVGFLWTSTYPQVWSIMIFIMTLFGFLAGSGVQYVLQKGFFGYFICGLCILLGVEFLWILIFLVGGKGTYVLLVPLAGKQILLSLCYSPFIYVLFHKIFQKVGGNRLSK